MLALLVFVPSLDVRVKIGPPQAAAIRDLPPARSDGAVGSDDGVLLVRRNGRELRVPPAGGYAIAQDVRFGSDGSLLITCRSSNEMYTVSNFIHYRGKDTLVRVVPGEDTFVYGYTDRRNYVCTSQETGAGQYPQGPPTTYRVVNGKPRKIGVGGPALVWPGGMVLSVPVNGAGEPSGLEFTVGNRLVLRAEGAVRELGAGSVLRRLGDGGLLLSSNGGGTQSAGSINGVGSPAPETLSLWQAGAFRSRRTLPEGWSSVMANARGDVLVRRLGPHATMEDLKPEAGMTREGVEGMMDRMMQDPRTGEEDWTMGVLRGGTITPYAFPRPKGSEGLLWRETEGFGESGTVLFSAFYADKEVRYRLTPRG